MWLTSYLRNLSNIRLNESLTHFAIVVITLIAVSLLHAHRAFMVLKNPLWTQSVKTASIFKFPVSLYQITYRHICMYVCCVLYIYVSIKAIFSHFYGLQFLPARTYQISNTLECEITTKYTGIYEPYIPYIVYIVFIYTYIFEGFAKLAHLFLYNRTIYCTRAP